MFFSRNAREREQTVLVRGLTASVNVKVVGECRIDCRLNRLPSLQGRIGRVSLFSDRWKPMRSSWWGNSFRDDSRLGHCILATDSLGALVN